MIHLPILRHGVAYRSVDVATVVHHRTRQPFVQVSQANTGLIRRDLLRQEDARAELAAIPARELIAMAASAAELFMTATLPLDPIDGVTQSPQEYVEQLSSTTGLPHVLVRRNMRKIHGVLSQMGDVIAGLTRGLDISVLDTGVGESDGHLFSFYPRGHSLGVVLPNNSPGVHSLWAPAIGMKTPLVLKPGSSEPWTPYRIAYALMQAGVRSRRSASIRPITPAAAKCCAARAAACSSATPRPRAGSRATHASRCTAPATARWSSARTASTTGRTTSRSSRRRSPTTAAARA